MLDAIAWMDSPGVKEIAQYADVDPRTAGKVLKNAVLVRLVQSADDCRLGAYLLSFFTILQLRGTRR